MTDDLTIPAILDRRRNREIAEFKPQATKEADAKADAVIDYAKRVKDWTMLELAVDEKLDEQAAFVGWWRENVSIRHGGDRARTQTVVLALTEAEHITGITQQQVSKWAKRLEDRTAYRNALFGTIYRNAMGERGQSELRGASGTGENEWYTPAEYLNAARDVLGAFDLDPASSDAAQKIIKAKRYFTLKTDGLKQEWVGRVWLNPPFAQPHIAEFVSKMVAERKSGRVSAAVMLTHNYTDTSWFHEAASEADAICFTRGRVKFYDANGVVAAPTQGQAFFYFGDDVAIFASRFSDIGFVVTPYMSELL